MTVVIAHGIRQANAKKKMRPIVDELESRGIPTHFADYGYILMPTTNNKAVRAIHNAARMGEDVVAYSNAAWAAVRAAEEGLHIRHLILVSPALNPSTRFPESINRITVFFCPSDRATKLGGIYAKATRILPWRWRNPHGFGEMGNKGARRFDHRVNNIRFDSKVRHSWLKHPDAVEQVASAVEEFCVR